MSKTIDPLIVLKDHIQNNKKIDKQGQYLIFSDDVKLKLDTPTACTQTMSNKQYTLGSLWFYLKNRTIPLATYIKECQKEKIDTISSMDKGK
jgi:hypothetical protein